MKAYMIKEDWYTIEDLESAKNHEKYLAVPNITPSYWGRAFKYTPCGTLYYQSWHADSPEEAIDEIMNANIYKEFNPSASSIVFTKKPMRTLRALEDHGYSTAYGSDGVGIRSKFSIIEFEI